MRGKLLLFFVAVSVVFTPQARAVLFASTDGPSFNTTEPTGLYAGSGWQFQGRYGNFLGTPIAPQYFITAEHIGGFSVGVEFVFLGQTYTTDAVYDDPSSDLRIWHVTTAFPTFAPLYTRSDEAGKEFVVFGRGTQRGAEVQFAAQTRGWLWGTQDHAQRWGTNTVDAVVPDSTYGDLLAADFDLSGPATEAHLSLGDSGGAIFIRDSDGVWKLAGINFSVDGPYYTSALGAGQFNAALHEQAGFFVETAPGVFSPATGPGSLYATRLSSNIAFIQQVTGVPEPSVAATIGGALALLAMRRRRLVAEAE